MRARQHRLTATTLLACVPAALLMTGCQQDPPRREPVSPEPIHEYVALGDSYTSAPWVPVVRRAKGCYRSTQSYPAQLATRLGAELDDRSCSGADTSALTHGQRDGIPPQVAGLSRRTDLVTVGLGGNDNDLLEALLGGCVALRAVAPEDAPCRTAMRRDGPDRLAAAIDSTEDRLVRALRTVRQRAPRATVLLVGYPHVFPTSGTCPDVLPLADGDVAYAAATMADLDAAMRRAAERAGVGFVDLRGPTTGHDVCAEDPWVAGAEHVPGRAMAYHPFVEEQTAAAEAILAVLQEVG